MNNNHKVIVIGLVAAAAIIPVAFIAGNFQQIQQHKEECDNLTMHINEMKGSIGQELFNHAGIQQLVDQYNTDCTAGASN